MHLARHRGRWSHRNRPANRFHLHVVGLHVHATRNFVGLAAGIHERIEMLVLDLNCGHQPLITAKRYRIGKSLGVAVEGKRSARPSHSCQIRGDHSDPSQLSGNRNNLLFSEE